MKPSELFRRVMSGELLLIGECRGCRVVQKEIVDTKSGQKIISLLMEYVVEYSPPGSCFPVIKIKGNAPDGAKEPKQVIITVEKGKRYAFPIQSLNRERDLTTAWIGKGEPLMIEEEAGCAGLVAAPLGAATSPAHP